MAQASDTTTTTKKKKVVTPPMSISDRVRAAQKKPLSSKPKPKPVTKAPTKPNPGQSGMVTPPAPLNTGGGGGGGGSARKGGGAKLLAPLPSTATPTRVQTRTPVAPATPSTGYNPLRTLAQNWNVGANLQRLTGAATPTATATPGLRNVPPLAPPPAAPRAYLGERPMTGDGNQPAQQFTWNTPTPAPAQTLVRGGATVPPNFSDLGRAGAGMAVGGNGIPAPATQPPWVRGATQGAITAGLASATQNTPLPGQAVMPPTAGAGATGGGASYGVPPGVDPVWYKQFTDEHGGQTPEEVYKYSDDPLGQALWDKAWGDQFKAGNYREPTQEDWNQTYGQRYGMYSRGQNIYGQGGMGGYGGGGGGGAPAPAPAPAASTIPQLYQAGFNLAFGVPGSSYYTPERGGEKQMQADYYALHDIFQNALGRPVDPGEWERIWRDLLAYKAGRGNQAAPLSMAEVYGFANRITKRPPQPPEISNLNLSEM